MCCATVSGAVDGRSNILVTGASGFVGRALVPLLRQHGNRVRAAVRSPTHCEADEVVPVGQITADTNWASALTGIDCVVHLAARVHVMRDPPSNTVDEFRRTNVDATLALARASARSGVRRFVFISSIGVNGNSSVSPFTESAAPAPVEPYAISKREAEDALRHFACSAAMQLTIIRPPLVYGAGAPGNFGRLVQIVRRGLPLPLGAVRHNRRTLIALDNLVDLVMVCVRHPAAGNQLFLAGDDEDVSTADLICRLAAALEVPVRLVPLPVSILRVAARVFGTDAAAQRLLGDLQVDSSKARNLLGWRPPVTLDEGLRRAAAPRPGDHRA